jgi:repressor of nif and glnA expression
MNMSLVDKTHREAVAALLPPVFASGLAHGRLMALFEEGTMAGGNLIPAGKIGLGTVCSITFNGALIQEGIPVTSIFGGLLEVQNRTPDRFTAAIRYDGTSLDPLEIYISSRMTSTGSAASSGTGLIGASFREIPSSAREQAEETDDRLKRLGLGGCMKFGYPSQSLLDIPVGEGRTGLIIPGGLNAVAPLVENGIPIESKALSGLVDYSLLFPFEELAQRLSGLK